MVLWVFLTLIPQIHQMYKGIFFSFLFVITTWLQRQLQFKCIQQSRQRVKINKQRRLADRRWQHAYQSKEADWYIVKMYNFIILLPLSETGTEFSNWQ